MMYNSVVLHVLHYYLIGIQYLAQMLVILGQYSIPIAEMAAE